MQEWINAHPRAMFVIAPVYAVALCMLVSVVISYIGGWSSLAKRFATKQPFSGERWTGQSGQMRWIAGYHNCLTLGANEKGLFLATMILFRVKHPPLLIPWNEISITPKRLWILGDFVRLTLGRQESVPLLIRRKLADKLSGAAGGRWPVTTIG